MQRNAISILSDWKMTIGLLAAIVTPSITAASLYYGLKENIVNAKAELNDRVGNLELKSQQNFADKESLKDIQKDVKEIRNDITEIKILLKKH